MSLYNTLSNLVTVRDDDVMMMCVVSNVETNGSGGEGGGEQKGEGGEGQQ